MTGIDGVGRWKGKEFFSDTAKQLCRVPCWKIGPSNQVFLVYVIEQLIESRLLQPLILGSSLKMHPVTILVILLAAGKMFGLTGLLIAVPVYAVVKVFVTHFFAWYKDYSGLYYTPEEEVEEIIEVVITEEN